MLGVLKPMQNASHCYMLLYERSLCILDGSYKKPIEIENETLKVQIDILQDRNKQLRQALYEANDVGLY